MLWLYDVVILPIVSYGCVCWINALQKKTFCRLFHKIQRIACMMMVSAYPGTPTAALEIILNIPPMTLVIQAEAAKAAHRLGRSQNWTTRVVGSSGLLKSHVDLNNDLLSETAVIGLVWDDIVPSLTLGQHFFGQGLGQRGRLR